MLGLRVVVGRCDLLASPELCRRHWRRTLLRMVLQLTYGAALKLVELGSHRLLGTAVSGTRTTLIPCCTTVPGKP